MISAKMKYLAANGSVYAQIGCDILPKLNLALYAGYIGTGKDNREIALGTRPKAVLVCTEYGVMWTSGGVYGGLALDGTPTKARTDTGTVYSLVTITETGFKLRQPGNSYIQGNASNTVYHYIAFC